MEKKSFDYVKGLLQFLIVTIYMGAFSHHLYTDFIELHMRPDIAQIIAFIFFLFITVGSLLVLLTQDTINKEKNND